MTSAGPDAFEHDLFIMHADADAKFVHDYLLPAVGLDHTRVLLPSQLSLGMPMTAEIERGVQNSRFTVVVLTPAYMADQWAIFGQQLASHRGDGRLLPLLLADCQVPLQLDFLVTLDFRNRDHRADQARRLREHVTARSNRTLVSPQSGHGSMAASTSAVGCVEPAERRSRAGGEVGAILEAPQQLAGASTHRAPPPRAGKAAGKHSFPGDAIDDERIAKIRQQVDSALRGYDQAANALATSIGCPRGELVERLVSGMSASELVQHWLAAFRAVRASPDRKRDVEGLRAVLFAVLPYLTDWRNALTEGRASSDASRVMVRGFASYTVAEAIVAGLHERDCAFMNHPQIGPCGVAMVHVPAAQRTALFKSGDRLREGVVAQLAEQLPIASREGPDHDRRLVNETLRMRAAGISDEPLRYYFVCRDDAANPARADTEWELALTSLGDPQGVPGLALIRMQGEHDDAEIALKALLFDMLRDASSRRGEVP